MTPRLFKWLVSKLYNAYHTTINFKCNRDFLIIKNLKSFLVHEIVVIILKLIYAP